MFLSGSELVSSVLLYCHQTRIQQNPTVAVVLGGRGHPGSVEANGLRQISGPGSGEPGSPEHLCLQLPANLMKVLKPRWRYSQLV